MFQNLVGENYFEEHTSAFSEYVTKQEESSTVISQNEICDIINSLNVEKSSEEEEEEEEEEAKAESIPNELGIQDSDNSLSKGKIKPHSTPATLFWLEKNYCLTQGNCIPRHALYTHYTHFCKSNFMNPLNCASFGKIIRQVFPTLTTKRLGTRGKSRYHYYGIAVRESSPYYSISFSKLSLNCKDGRKSVNKNNASFVLSKDRKRSKVWPRFPNITDISFPPEVSQEKINSFIIMYHTHCQRIFDTMIRGALNDAYQYLEHFWRGVPSHLSELLNTNTVVNMVGICDLILYRAISHVLMLSVLKKCSENLIQMFRDFVNVLENWIETAMKNVPANIKAMKLKIGRRFCKTLKGQLVLYQLTHAAQLILIDFEIIKQINEDWKKINLRLITQQALIFTESSKEHVEVINCVYAYWEKFQELIQQPVPIEDFTERLESIVHFGIIEMSERKKIPLKKAARNFLLLWHLIKSLISRDLTIHSATSFGSFHLIQTLFDEYLHYLVEILHLEEITKYLLENVSSDVLTKLDLNWKKFKDVSGFGMIDTSSNLPAMVSFPGMNLQFIQNDFQNTNFSFFSNVSDSNFSKVNDVQSDCTFMANPCIYQNMQVRESEPKSIQVDSFLSTVPVSRLSSNDQNCIEFSAGIYYREASECDAPLQFQSSSYNERINFEYFD